MEIATKVVRTGSQWQEIQYRARQPRKFQFIGQLTKSKHFLKIAAAGETQPPLLKLMGKLAVIELGVEAAPFQKLPVLSFFHNVPVPHD